MLNTLKNRMQGIPTTVNQRFAARHIDHRYLTEFIRFCEQNHLFGDKALLSHLAVEPRFIAPEPLPETLDEEVDPDIFDMVPNDPRYPSLHAAYNIPTLGIAELSHGVPHIAILGNPGSGRTFALMCIALWSLGLLEFKPPYDKVKAEIDKFEAKLTPEERAKRIKHRIRIAQLAQERMSESDGKSFVGTDEDAEPEIPQPYRERVPIYCHLAEFDFQSMTKQQTIDPAEPLIGLWQNRSSYLTAKTLPRSLYRAISDGNATLLIDGYEDLPAEDQSAARDWLEEFIRTYPRNYVIITGPVSGYHWLQELDIAPVFIRPWHQTTTSGALESLFEGKGELEDVERDALLQQCRFLSPIDVALFANYSLSETEDIEPNEESDEDGRNGYQHLWPRTYLSQRLDDLGAWLPFLQSMAEVELDNGQITIRAMAEKENRQRNWTPLDVLDEENSAKGDSQATSPRRRIARILSFLMKSGILIQHRAQRFQFKHHVLASYIASEGLKYADPEELAQKALDGRWERAIGYAAELVPIDVAVQAKLAQPQDIAMDTILGISNWLSYAGKSATWRSHYLRLLGNMLVAPNQYSPIRQRVAAAIVSSRDDGAIVILRAAVQNPNPDVRRIACLGLGAIRDIAAVQPLRKLLQNPDEAVKIAATLSLGAIATDESLVAMVEAMQQSNSRGVRRAAAEMLALYPEVGYETLYDAINEVKDILMRRAIIFGLGRIRTNWALITINEVVSSGSEEYYVRLAAMEVFRKIYEKESQGVLGYPDTNSIPWLLSWGGQQVRSGTIDEDTTGDAMLHFAMNSRNDDVRYMALLTASQLELPQSLRHVYQKLSDPSDRVRDIAYRALINLQRGFAKSLPAPA